MFGNQQQRPIDGTGKGSVVYKAISALGSAIGLGVAILATPLLFEATRDPLFQYLQKTWGHDLADVLTWVFGGVEGFILYIGVKLLFTFLILWSMAALAAKRFPVA